MSNRQSFTKLRDALAYLYSDEASTRRVAHDADLDISQISFSNRAIDNWHNVLSQAQKEGKTASLMAITFREYRENELFAKVWHDYLLTLGSGGVSTPVYLSPSSPSNTNLLRWLSIAVGVMAISVISLVLWLRSFILPPATPIAIVPTSTPTHVSPTEAHEPATATSIPSISTETPLPSTSVLPTPTPIPLPPTSVPPTPTRTRPMPTPVLPTPTPTRTRPTPTSVPPTPTSSETFPSGPLKADDLAPEFTLADSKGNIISLYEELKNNNIALIFYFNYG